jgi:hypothetical protein
MTYLGRCHGGPWDSLKLAHHLPTKEILAPGVSLGFYEHDGEDVWIWKENELIYNGVCKGGPLDGRGLTHDKDTKFLVASNNDGQQGKYHYDHNSPMWVWQAEGQEQPMGKAAEEQINMQIRENHANAPRITPEIIDSRIRQVKYYNFPGTTLMICAIELMNGHHAVGESACASPSNYDEAIGRRLAYDCARRKIWELEAYVLRNVLKGM